MPKNHKDSGSVFGVVLVLLIVAGGIGWYVMHSRAQTDAGGGGQAAGKGHGGGRFALNGPMPVAVFTAQKGEIPVVVNALGTVTPLATVTVRTQISGQLTQVAYQEGQAVKAGDFLAQVDPRPYQLQLSQMQGQLQKDQALLQTAKNDLARFSKLVKEDSIAQQQYDTQVQTVKQDEGVVQTDQAQVDNARLNLAYCHITAPISGRLGLRQVDIGNFVQTGDANGIVVITQMDPVSVIFSVPEDSLPSIMKRMASGAVLPATAFNRNQTQKLADGALTTVDNAIDTTTGTVRMRAQFDNRDNALFANQFVNVQLLVDTLKDVIVIPNSAVQRGAPGTFVYIVKPDDTVTVTPVTLGPASGDNIAVLTGLQPGQVIVSDGADKLKDGAKVTVPGATPPVDPNAPPAAAAAKDDASGQHHHHKQQQQ